jgi:hypothetical protein
MPVKKVQDVTPTAETTVFEELNAQEMKEEQVVVEKKEEALPVSLVEKMMKDLEEKLLNKFTSQINKLKTAESQKEIDSDLKYVEDLQEDWLEQPVVFFAFSMNFSIHGDKKRGVESTPPHGAIKFKPLVRTKRKRGRDVQVISVSSIKVNSQSEVDYLRNHSQYGIAFFENMTSAMAVDSTWAQKMMEAQQSISRLSDMQVIARVQQEGLPVTQSPEAMRRQLVELTAERAKAQQDRLLYGNLKQSSLERGTNRVITEKTITN